MAKLMQRNNEKIPEKPLAKVVVNSGIGRLATQANFEEKILPELMRDFALLTGQKPSVRRARQSIAGFKIRSGTIVGLSATLRGKRMDAFLEKLATVVFPRIRDFHGVAANNIDGSGNLNVGIRDHTVFPEISPETTRVNFGIEITAVLKKPLEREAAAALYRKIGIRFKK